MNEDITITPAQHQDKSALKTISEQRSQGYLEKCFEKQDQKQLEIFIVRNDEKSIGYVILNHKPKYQFFHKLGISEIQDLNVIKEFRNKGIGTALVLYCIDYLKNKGEELIGISVGLHSKFGPAQRLYCKLGFIPDGYGITYDRAYVSEGDIRPIDDALCLMMIKEI